MARVLLIDDDAEIRETTADQPRFDVAVLDLHLPRVDGDELLDLLRKNIATADLPVVFYSANSPHATSVHGLSLADTRLTKGRSLNSLLATINCLST